MTGKWGFRSAAAAVIVVLAGACVWVGWQNHAAEAQRVMAPEIPFIRTAVPWAPADAASPKGWEVPPGARPYRFNGRTVYIVPLAAAS